MRASYTAAAIHPNADVGCRHWTPAPGSIGEKGGPRADLFGNASPGCIGKPGMPKVLLGERTWAVSGRGAGLAGLKRPVGLPASAAEEDARGASAAVVGDRGVGVA